MLTYTTISVRVYGYITNYDPEVLRGIIRIIFVSRKMPKI
jgi:hypothetical protein